jgi:hypothetical protein
VEVKIIIKVSSVPVLKFENSLVPASRVPPPVIPVSVIPGFHIIFHINLIKKSSRQGPPAAGITDKSPGRGCWKTGITETGITGVGTRGAGTSEFRDNCNWVTWSALKKNETLQKLWPLKKFHAQQEIGSAYQDR